MTSQLDFDTPPLYDGILNTQNLYFSDIWLGYWSSLIQTLISYLTSHGVLIPNLTVAERDKIQTPVEGQLIYVTDVVPDPLIRETEIQVWQVKAGVGAWRTFTTTP